MKAKPIPLNQIRRDTKRHFASMSASALFDEFVTEVYAFEDLSVDDCAELKQKFKKSNRGAAFLIRLKKI